MKRSGLFALTLIAALLGPATLLQAQPSAAPGEPVLKPTSHPRLPAELWQFWLAPAKGASPTLAMNELAAAVKLEVDGNFAKALPILVAAGASSRARSAITPSTTRASRELRSGGRTDARRTFQALASKNPVGFLVEATPLREAEAAEALGDQAAALAIYERLSKTKTTAPDDVLMRLGRSARATGNDRRRRSRRSRASSTSFRSAIWRRSPSSELETLPIASRSRPGRTATSSSSDAPSGCSAPDGTRRRASPSTAVRQRGAGRRPRARQAPARRMRLLPEALARRARRRQAVHRERVAPGRSALLLRGRAPRARRPRRVPPRRPPPGQTSSRPRPGRKRRSTTSPPTTSSRTTTRGRTRRSASCTTKFPGGRYAERAAWKLGWWAYKNGRYARHHPRLRSGGGAVSAVRLPAAVAVLVGARARGAEGTGARRGALHAGRDRLPEQLLRPSGAARGWQGRARALVASGAGAQPP